MIAMLYRFLCKRNSDLFQGIKVLNSSYSYCRFLQFLSKNHHRSHHHDILKELDKKLSGKLLI